jgi:hypothetical protein
MHQGRMIALGTVDELRDAFSGSAVLEVECDRIADAIPHLDARVWVHDVSAFGSRLHVVTDDLPEIGDRVAEELEEAGFGPVRVEQVIPSLEDIFIRAIEDDDSRRSA